LCFAFDCAYIVPG